MKEKILLAGEESNLMLLMQWLVPLDFDPEVLEIFKGKAPLFAERYARNQAGGEII